MKHQRGAHLLFIFIIIHFDINKSDDSRVDLINQHTTMIHESIYSSTAVGAGVIYQELADAAFSTLDTRSRSVQS